MCEIKPYTSTTTTLWKLLTINAIPGITVLAALLTVCLKLRYELDND